MIRPIKRPATPSEIRGIIKPHTVPEPVTTAIVPVKFDRIIVDTAYDISDVNANIDLGGIRTQSHRNIINVGKLGKTSVVSKSAGMEISAEQYAMQTGLDIGKTPVAMRTIEVFRTQTTRDVYPSITNPKTGALIMAGRTYENIIGSKGIVELPGSMTIGQISSRGIASGEGVVAWQQVDLANDIIWNTIAKPRKTIALHPNDLVASITDVTSGLGTISVASNIPEASLADVASTNIRIVRGIETFETMFGSQAITKSGAGTSLGVNLPGSMKSQQASSLFKSLPDYGVKVSEIYGNIEHVRPAPITTHENIFDASNQINGVLFGKESSAFETEAARLRENVGVEKLMNTGVSRSGGLITPLSETFGRPKPKGRPSPEGTATGLKLISFGSESVAAKEASSKIGNIIKSLITKQHEKNAAKAEAETKETSSPARERISQPVQTTRPGSAFAQWGRRVFVYDEESAMYPSRLGLEKTGISSREGFVDPLQTARVPGSIMMGSLRRSYGLEFKQVPEVVSRQQRDIAEKQESDRAHAIITGQIAATRVADAAIASMVGVVREVSVAQRERVETRVKTSQRQEEVPMRTMADFVDTITGQTTATRTKTKTTTDTTSREGIDYPQYPKVLIPGLPDIPPGGGGGGALGPQGKFLFSEHLDVRKIRDVFFGGNGRNVNKRKGR